MFLPRRRVDARPGAWSTGTAMKRPPLLLIGVAVVALGIYWYARPSPAGKGSVLFEVKKGEFTAKLSELGELRALRSATILAEKDAPIAYLVPEGTSVKEGDVLVRFDPTQSRGALTAGDIELAAAQADLKHAREDLEAQRQKLLAERARLAAEVELAQMERDGLARLLDKGFVARTELEKATIRLRQAQTALDRSEKGLRPELQALEANVEQKRAGVAKAKNLIDKAKGELGKTELRAPQPGFVIYAKAREGSGERIHLGMMAFAGQPLITLPDITTMVVDTEVNEIDIGKVTVGAPVEVRIDAYGDAVFHGTVHEIGMIGRQKRVRLGAESTIKVFDVTAQIQESDARLKPGLTALVGILVDQQHDVLAIPLPAIVPREKGHVVYVQSLGALRERAVVLGPSNDRQVVVKEGLQPGDRVLLNPSVAR